MSKRGVGLHRQLIPREVGSSQRGGLLQVIKRLLRLLVGQSKHQIQIDTFKPRLLCHCYCINRFSPIVNAANLFKVCITEALHPNREAVDPRLTITVKVPLICSAGVGLQGNLWVGD